MVNEDVDVFLEHFGVKGMKWGVRQQLNRERLSRVANKTATADDKRKVYRKYGVRKPEHAAIIGKKLDSRKARRDKTVAFVKKHDKVIGAGVAIAAGAIGAKILLDKNKERAVREIKMQHQEFLKAKHLLDEKMLTRFSTLKNLSKKTPPGHPSHEGAMTEINNLKSFYETQLKKMSDRHGVSPETFRKMRTRPVI